MPIGEPRTDLPIDGGVNLDAYLYTRPQVGFVPRWSRLETALHRYPIISHRTIASEAAARHILGW